jgi:2-dehydro-3-deoxyphosphogluconate aldolase / (4S)-4-hydroxy-2-oxoglutarate aldolase
MRSQQAYDVLASSGVMAGMRGQFTPDVALRVTAVLVEEGINVFEFTMNSTSPVEAMQAVKREFGDDVCSGMGTVLDMDTARRVLDAGADFVVSPAFQADIVQVVLREDVLVAPGVMTPSEAVHAWSLGVRLLKLFPIGTLGVEHFKALFGPLNHMKFLCNGGINAENTREFLQAGAVACGPAAWLTGDGTTSLDTIRQRARLMREAVEAARGVSRQI